MDGFGPETRFPVVLRFEGLFPDQLARYESHRARKGGDLGHIAPFRSSQNRRLIGDEDWAAQALEEIAAMKATNFADELEALEKRKRRKEIRRRMAEGPHDPWRPTRHGPMREVILTANKVWFDTDICVFLGESENQRVEDFERLAVAWLRAQFGEDVIHARADLDEAAYHIHAVILPRQRVEMKRGGKVISERWMLQPSKFPVIEDYEVAQDSVGEWFREAGLVRGERRKAAAREAFARGETPPPKRRHIRTQAWRLEQQRKLAQKAKALEDKEREVRQREAEAETVLAVAEAVAAGDLDLETATPGALCGPDREAPPAKSLKRVEAAAQKAPQAAGRTLAVFRDAWEAMKRRARRDAVAEAKAAFSRAIAGLAEVVEVIRQAERILPSPQRNRLFESRRVISETTDRIKHEVAGTSVGLELHERRKTRKESRDDNSL